MKITQIFVFNKRMLPGAFFCLVTLQQITMPITNSNNDSNDGRNLPRWYENPVDNTIIDLTHSLNPTYRSLGVTPGIMFALSWVSSIAGLWLYQRSPKGSRGVHIGVTLYFIGYFFDRAEGNMRRTYNLPSSSPLSDNLSDLSTNIGVLYVLLKVTPSRHKGICVVAIAILCALSVVQLGCQEQDKERSHDRLCDKVNHARMLGWGTLVVAVCVFMLLLKG